MFDYYECWQRGITPAHVPNTMRSARMDEAQAEARIRELFPIRRSA